MGDKAEDLKIESLKIEDTKTPEVNFKRYQYSFSHIKHILINPIFPGQRTASCPGERGNIWRRINSWLRTRGKNSHLPTFYSSKTHFKAPQRDEDYEEDIPFGLKSEFIYNVVGKKYKVTIFHWQQLIVLIFSSIAIREVNNCSLVKSLSCPFLVLGRLFLFLECTQAS